jgi:hypothetical protein
MEGSEIGAVRCSAVLQCIDLCSISQHFDALHFPTSYNTIRMSLCVVR